jgi:uncharacterized membrane protein (UPF0127 family)
VDRCDEFGLDAQRYSIDDRWIWSNGGDDLITNEEGTVIARKVEFADSYLKKLRGLILRRSFEDTALVFPFRREIIVRIHMLFVLFPIDLLFLNESMRILGLATLKPLSDTDHQRCLSHLRLNYQ